MIARMQHVVVLGAGAIGSLYAARLSTTTDVTLVGRPAHVEAIARSGLCIDGLDPDRYQLNAVNRITAIAPDTVVILTTKVSDNASAIASIAPLIRPDTVILCLQNGLGGEDIARRLLPAGTLVLRGLTQFGAIFRGPGFIELKAGGVTLVEADPVADGLARMLTGCGLEGRVSSNIRADVWRKLIANCVINPITSITGGQVGSIADGRMDPVKHLVIAECLAVAAAEGVRIDGDLLAFINATFGPSRNTASMLQDLSRGHATEIDFMNGAVAERGAAHGIACPMNVALTTIVKTLERHSQDPDAPHRPALA